MVLAAQKYLTVYITVYFWAIYSIVLFICLYANTELFLWWKLCSKFEIRTCDSSNFVPLFQGSFVYSEYFEIPIEFQDAVLHLWQNVRSSQCFLNLHVSLGMYGHVLIFPMCTVAFEYPSLYSLTLKIGKREKWKEEERMVWFSHSVVSDSLRPRGL